MQTKFIIISGPSGVGKTVISKGLKEKIPNLTLAVATTSRLPRKNEINGKDYHFISDKDFKNKISNGEFIEWKKDDSYYGIEFNNLKSTLCLLNIDYQGMAQVKQKHPNSLTIFIKPPSLAILKKRLAKRALEVGMIDKEVKKRMDSAKVEIKMSKYYDYNIVNYENKLNQTIDGIIKIIDREIKCE